ncbi:MAG: hypothetical protein PHT71_07190, partial [Victivallaceae bacterium]|nr:hypothetical protein [Victivallaceae bacterium]
MYYFEREKESTVAPLEFMHFPTRMQAVIWRNWNIVSLKSLAFTLKATEKQIIDIASKMGLVFENDAPHELWKQRGYITIIRMNWHLLPLSQIIELLGWTAMKMENHLREDDFLWAKLGGFKPQTTPVYYRELNKAELRKTMELKDIIRKHFSNNKNMVKGYKPFDFLNDFIGSSDVPKVAKKDRFGFSFNMAYSYCAVYGDPLLSPESIPYSEKTLAAYMERGVNAVWLPGILYSLVPWLGENRYSNGYEKRQQALRELTERATKYGIKVYLYFNEPRAMPLDFFKGREGWLGYQDLLNNMGSLCVSNQDIKNRLKNGCTELFKAVPGLGGVFTITMSENLTNCLSKPRIKHIKCKHCEQRGIPEVVAEVNNIIEAGIHLASPEADVIVHTWAWDSEWLGKAIERLNQNVKIMSVSETALPTEANGIKGRVSDYSMSKIGPGPFACEVWKKASAHGLEVLAKVQINNTWECSAVPYIPVPGLVEEHLKNLKDHNISGLMTAWTLGGYPGGNYDLLYCPKEEIAISKFGKKAAHHILNAWECFDKAFVEFPLNGCNQLYKAPQNFGPMNLLHLKPSNYKATMMGYPYDDLYGWCGCGHFPEEIFEKQFKKLSE